MMKQRILLTGSSGMVGRALLPALQERYEVLSLHRGSGSATDSSIYWNPEEGLLDPQELEGFFAVVHLAGEPIGAKRWSRAQKQKLFVSRCRDTWLLTEGMLRTQRPPKVWIGASAVGIYGDRGDEEVTEESPAGPSEKFLVDLCQQWERATSILGQRGVRILHARLGVVVSPTGGALQKLLPLFRCGLGGRLGSGRQFLSWIALLDVVRAIEHLLVTEELSGAVNFVSPTPCRQAEWAAALAEQLHRPLLGNLPAWLVVSLLGEMGKLMLLEGVRALPKRLEETGYQFALPTLRECFSYYLNQF